MKRRNVLAAAAMVLAASACSQMKGDQSETGWTTLIDGEKGLENFTRLGGANWRAEGGAIVADNIQKTGYLLTKQSYRDFVIRAEFWAEPNTNSGIFHVPGGRFYDTTVLHRCYLDPAAAEADGLRASKR